MLHCSLGCDGLPIVREKSSPKYVEDYIVDHLTNNRPLVQHIIDKQTIAQHRLTHDKTTRSEPEMAHYRRVLQPVPLRDVELTKLPLVQVKGGDERYVLLGSVAQIANKVVLLKLDDDTITTKYTIDQLELASPADL